MRILNIFVLLFVVTWSGFWWFSMTQFESSIKNWFENAHFSDYRKYESISVSGYPNRLDATLKNVTVVNKNSEFSLSAPLIQFLTVIYNKELIINTIKLPLNIELKDNQFTIEGELIKTSLKLNNENQIQEFISQGEDLIFKTPKGQLWRIKNSLLAYDLKQNNAESTYKSHFALNNVQLPSNFIRLIGNTEFFGNSIKKLTFNGNINLSHTTSNIFLENKIEGIKELELSLDWGKIRSSLNGDLEILEDGRLSGVFNFKISSWEEILDYFEIKNILEKETVRIIRGGLTFIASQSSEEKLLSIPLYLKKNLLFLGPIKIGDITKILYF